MLLTLTLMASKTFFLFYFKCYKICWKDPVSQYQKVVCQEAVSSLKKSLANLYKVSS